MKPLTFDELKSLDRKKIHLTAKIHQDWFTSEIDGKYNVWVNRDINSPNYGIWIMKPRATRRGIRVNNITFEHTFTNPMYEIVK